MSLALASKIKEKLSMPFRKSKLILQQDFGDAKRIHNKKIKEQQSK